MGDGLGFTVMVNVAVVAHKPAVGENVYVVVVVLFKAGVHVPVMPFNDVVGNAAIVAPAQMDATGLNVGVVAGPVVPIVTPVVTMQPLLSFK